MDSSKKIDAVEKIKQFRDTILSNKPDMSEMVYDVRMMNFKIRPVSGDITELDYDNGEFIDALWSLGKLDEFFRSEFEQVDSHERESFFRLINELRVNFQNQLRSAELQGGRMSHQGVKDFFEIEIIKENNLRAN